ncbi:hypothetical protein BRC81_12470 [Halobacteriales archaeon QS_1_68_20]|nr:MAG: hypothetical protein BRC81_12470 [Halobacteriales archaeon QS_1_68_20]
MVTVANRTAIRRTVVPATDRTADGGGDGGGIGGGDGGGIGGGGHVCPSPPIDLDDFDFEDGDLKYDLSDDWNLYGSGGADPPYVELGVEYEW